MIEIYRIIIEIYQKSKQKYIMNSLQRLLDEIALDSGENNEARKLVKEYPELKELWLRFVRTNNLYMMYNRNFSRKKTLLWRLFHPKASWRYRMKLAYLERSKNERYEEYEFLRKMVADY